jgi:NAD(P)H-hydrate repair Nnr-like enzyme with NAD(P)H-hydrate dehydratase domain
MDYSYWKKQALDAPLFPDIEWSKPEQKSQAGKLGIIGGNKLGFAGVAEAYSVALQAGVGHIRVLLPDVLRKTIPAAITDAVFAPTNLSGSLSKEALDAMDAMGAWAQEVLLIGDAGRSSETAILYEQFIQKYQGQLVITRDAVDLVKNSAELLVERPKTTLIVSFAQLQKLFQAVYYPKVLTFSMQLTNLVEAVHKFTITYPVTIVVLHQDYLVIAHEGEVATQEWTNPMLIWRGSVAAKAAAYWLWSPSKPLEAIASSIYTKQ